MTNISTSNKPVLNRLGTPAGADMSTDIANIDTKIGTPTVDLATDISNISGFSPAPVIVYVDVNASGANDGTSWTNAYTDIKSAVDSCSGGETILVAPGQYTVNSDINVDVNNLSIISSSGSGCTYLLGGGGTNATFYVTGDNTHIEGFIIHPASRRGIELEGNADNFVIRDCHRQGNPQVGGELIRADGGRYGLVENCTSNQRFCDLNDSCQYWRFINCHAVGQGSFTGFDIDGHYCTFINCSASHFVTGFSVISGATHNNLINCTASDCSASGFSDAGTNTHFSNCFEETPTEGTYTYLDAGGEQNLFELTGVINREILAIWLDLTNLTQDGTVTIYGKQAGLSVYTAFKTISWTQATDPKLLQLDGFPTGITGDLKVSWTEGADEGADRDIGYEVIYRGT